MIKAFYQEAKALESILQILMLAMVVGFYACQPHVHADIADDEEEISTSVTRWTKNIELFAEFPLLTMGRESRFAVHVTELKTYKPISDAIVTVNLVGKNGVNATVGMPVRPGIFAPVLKPGQSGTFKLTFEIRYDTVVEQIDGGAVTVFANWKEAMDNVPEEKGGDITFLKEQAWKTNFSVRPVVRKVIEERIQVAGEVLTNPSKITTISTTAAGIMVFSREFHPGKSIRKGEKIGVIVGKDIVAGVSAEENLQHVFLNARASLSQAEANFQRHKQLHEDKVISTLEFEQHQLAYDLARSEFQTVSNNYVESMGGIELLVSNSGNVAVIEVRSGDYVEVGDPVLSVIPINQKLLHLDVPISHYSKINFITGLRWLESESWLTGKPSVVSYSPQVDPGKAFFSMWFNPGPMKSVAGKFVHAELIFSTKGLENVTVPSSSILEDFGVYSVMVQITGESFEKREITPGKRNSEFTEILSGVEEGDMVVVDGVYQVKMASMAGEAPAHGHEH